MGVAINIQIVSATGVGGVFPFVVVCFDGGVEDELYKTDAVATSGGAATWNHNFALDLTSNIKAVVANGRPEPTYITFFIFDTGTPGVPALGSAGVLLATVKEHGRAQGDFPVVNGTGSLRLKVTSDKTKKSATQEGHNRFGMTDQQSHQAKVAAGAVGATALAAGLAGLAVHHKKKKKREDGDESSSDDDDHEEKKKKGGLIGKVTRGLGIGGDGSSDEENSGEGERGESVQVQSSSQAWTGSVPGSDAAPKDASRGIAVENGQSHPDAEQQRPDHHTQPDVYVEEADGDVHEEDAEEYDGHEDGDDYEDDDYEDDAGADDE